MERTSSPERNNHPKGIEIISPTSGYEPGAIALDDKAYSDKLGVGSQNIVLSGADGCVDRIGFGHIQKALDLREAYTWDDAAEALQREQRIAKMLEKHFPDHLLSIDLEWQRVTFSPEVLRHVVERAGRGKGFIPPEHPVTCNTLVGRQPLFTMPEGAEVLSLWANKIDALPVVPYGEHPTEGGTEDPRGIYTRAAMNQLLCQVDEDGDFAFGWTPEKDASFIQAAYSPGNSVYVWERLQADEKFRKVHGEFLQKCAVFTHETGELVDIIGKDNVLAIQNEDKDWDIVMIDAVYPHPTQHEFFIDLINSDRDIATLSEADRSALMFFQNNTLTYVRYINLLSKTAGLKAPLDIRHANLDPSQERVIDEIEWSRWCALQEFSYGRMGVYNISPQSAVPPVGSYKGALPAR